MSTSDFKTKVIQSKNVYNYYIMKA